MGLAVMAILFVVGAGILGQEDPSFTFELPSKRVTIPQLLKAGERPGFPVRGIKGWMWKPEQYFNVVPVLAAHKMNFLMNCYTNMCDVEHYSWGDPKANRWWEPVPAPKKEWLERLVKLCHANHVQFCFSMNPGLNSERPINYKSADDLEAIWHHYAWMQSLGVKWFNLSLDDISHGIDAEGQVRLVNEIFRRLRAKDPKVQFIFCPTWYWGTGKELERQTYLSILARDLNKDSYVFWTGDDVLGPITRKAAESYKSVVRHRLFLWDNYPVNDGNPTMHLGPVIHRDPDLGDVIDGYMSNSMCQQADSNQIPMLTCADYAYNPRAYDPARSIGQSILNVAKSERESQVLRDLVLAYPGNLRFYHGEYNTSYDPVRESFLHLSAPELAAFVERIGRLAKEMAVTFPNSYLVERGLVVADVAWMKGQLK